MLISELIKNLQDIHDKHGDLSIQVVRRVWGTSNLPPGAMGGGGAGWEWNWCGTVKKLQVSEKHSDQLELVTTS